MKPGRPPIQSYGHAAWWLRCEVPAIEAVAEVEAGPLGAFLDTGEPVILFERRVFDRLTKGKFRGARADSLPDDYSLISDPDPGGYGPVSAQHDRLAAAVRLDRGAALASASWGLFQIMGFNHQRAGFAELQDFVNAMYQSVDEHLRAFCWFILSDPKLLEALRDKDWPTFARLYNGPDYRKNRYDDKMARAYDRALTRPRSEVLG